MDLNLFYNGSLKISEIDPTLLIYVLVGGLALVLLCIFLNNCFLSLEENVENKTKPAPDAVQLLHQRKTRLGIS